jgi:hypothetical protein
MTDSKAPRASLRAKLNAYAERPPVFVRGIDFLDRHRPIPGFKVLGFVLSSACVTYALAAIFGVGIHGLESTGQLDNASTYPDANGFMIVALPTYFVGGFLSSCGSSYDVLTKRSFLTWLASTLAAGVLGLVLVALLT